MENIQDKGAEPDPPKVIPSQIRTQLPETIPGGVYENYDLQANKISPPRIGLSYAEVFAVLRNIESFILLSSVSKKTVPDEESKAYEKYGEPN